MFLFIVLSDLEKLHYRGIFKVQEKKMLNVVLFDVLATRH